MNRFSGWRASDTTSEALSFQGGCCDTLTSSDHKQPIVVAYEKKPEIRIYDARGNGEGGVAPTITGDHNGHLNDYMAVVLMTVEARHELARCYDGNAAPPIIARAGTGGGNTPIVLLSRAGTGINVLQRTDDGREDFSHAMRPGGDWREPASADSPEEG